MFGRSEILPRATPALTTSDVLSVVLQVCNYGAPDAELTVEYQFFTTSTASARCSTAPNRRFWATRICPRLHHGKPRRS